MTHANIKYHKTDKELLIFYRENARAKEKRRDAIALDQTEMKIGFLVVTAQDGSADFMPIGLNLLVIFIFMHEVLL